MSYLRVSTVSPAFDACLIQQNLDTRRAGSKVKVIRDFGVNETFFNVQ